MYSTDPAIWFLVKANTLKGFRLPCFLRYFRRTEKCGPVCHGFPGLGITRGKQTKPLRDPASSASGNLHLFLFFFLIHLLKKGSCSCLLLAQGMRKSRCAPPEPVRPNAGHWRPDVSPARHNTQPLRLFSPWLFLAASKRWAERGDAALGSNGWGQPGGPVGP